MNSVETHSYNQVLGNGWGTWLFHGSDVGQPNTPYVGNNCCGGGDRFSAGGDFPANVIIDGAWTHLVYTYDNSLGSNNAKLYSNGVIVGQKNLTTGAAWNAFSISGANAAFAEIALYN